MQRIGLALSGGGFRATLFHLGMIRFLKEANILPAVTHITSVSGGSILAAHLALHWQRYNESLKEFDDAAAELIGFIQLDIRNRVVRRYPLAMPLRALRRLALLGSRRQLTRTGLLEYHYEKLLYGDTCLNQLPQEPRLYILATNLSEGCLCAFTRDGLLMQRRQRGQRFRFDRIHAGLATVPMAVAASSAFPGFFPPLELHGLDVGADPGQFGRLSFTDGGIYDNLGVRMFRCLEQSWMAREIQLRPDYLTNADEIDGTLRAAAQANDDTPLRRIAQMMLIHRRRSDAPLSRNESVEQMLDGVLKFENLAREPAFAHVTPPDPAALPLMQAAQAIGGEIDAGEQLWLNRQLVDAAYRQATGKSCFRSLNACFDTVLVSDAGKQFKISANTRAGGLISTAMRSTDIVMDRVWQLETDTFRGTPGFVFAPIGKVVDQHEDPTALHPEIQRTAADIRTDLDRFTPLEISALVRHGYCVGRSVCRSRPDLFGDNLPSGPPWDPVASELDKPKPTEAPHLHSKSATATLETKQSRTLQKSAGRRLWSSLLDYRDWTSFVYVPLLVPILFVLPYYGVKWYRQAQTAQRLIEGMAQSNGDFEVMAKLLQDGPTEPFVGMPMIEDQPLPPLDYSGFNVIADTRIIDMRPWRVDRQDPDERSWAYGYRRLRVKKMTAEANEFVVRIRAPATKGQARVANNLYPAVLRVGHDANLVGGKPAPAFDLVFDLSKVPVSEVVDLSFEVIGREPSRDLLRSTSVYVDAKTALLTCWILLPEGKHYEGMKLLRYSTDKPAAAPERVVPATEMISPDGQIAAFALLSVEPGFMYERRYQFRD